MVFDRHYADCYDLFYGSKDYESECDMIEAIFADRGVTPSSLVDLGCGTGRHSSLLAKRGYVVTGVDKSKEMLQHAQERIKNSGVTVSLMQQELEVLNLRRSFDAAVAMFAVIGYLWTNDALMTALRRIFDHVKPGGIFIFDCWYGPAVITHGPQQRFQRFVGQQGEEVVRLVTPHSDNVRQVVDVEYETFVISDGRVSSRSTENHRMRYFHPMEIRLALETVGFREIEIGVFGKPEQSPTANDWNIVVSAQHPSGTESDAGPSSKGGTDQEVDIKP